MTVSVCPSENSRAPVSAVWSLLADPRAYHQWIDAYVDSIMPDGPATHGQRILLRAPTRGRWFKVWIDVEHVDSEHHVIELTTRFPFGLRLLNRIAAIPIDARTTRVQFG